MNIAFFPLFNHIKSRDIAMTSPVEMDYHGWDTENEKPDAFTMSFLYRTTEDGPVEDAGRVKVVDVPAMTVLSVGMKGRYAMQTSMRASVVLEDWLRANPQWEVAGDFRTLNYNGPDMPASRRWAEIQIPIRPAAAAGGSESDQTGSAADSANVRPVRQDGESEGGSPGESAGGNASESSGPSAAGQARPRTQGAS